MAQSENEPREIKSSEKEKPPSQEPPAKIDVELSQDDLKNVSGGVMLRLKE